MAHEIIGYTRVTVDGKEVARCATFPEVFGVLLENGIMFDDEVKSDWIRYMLINGTWKAPKVNGHEIVTEVVY